MQHQLPEQFNFGDRRLVGQSPAREQMERIIRSGRISHAYLFSGPKGTGKKAFALAFAEIINGISNLTGLGDQAFSKKSSWFTHPDIHLFLPVPTRYTFDDLQSRLDLLREDPYEVVDFSLRPSLSDDDSSKNKMAFYPIDYFRDEIRPTAFLKPNEGRKTVIILSDIEHLRKEAANAFLKLLEEPSDNLIFLLTVEHTDSLLPTIISRCQQIPLSPLKTEEIRRALVDHDGVPEEDARYLARISGGNYGMTRFFDVESLKKSRGEIIDFLRHAWSGDAVEITSTARDWHSEHNVEGQIVLLNILETFLHDLLVYRSTENVDLITNADQIDVIRKFCGALTDARLEEMIGEIERCRPLIYQYVQPKLVYTVLAMRFSLLMRGEDPEISREEPWRHLPAYTF